MARPPTDPAWRRFCERYTETAGFWYVPKGEAVNDLARIQARLQLLKDRFLGERWTSAQLPYVNALRREHLFAPRGHSTKVEDRTAIARMIKVVFHTLGLAWVDQDDAVFISPAGEKFLDASSPQGVVESQLWKFQLWNPSLPEDYKEFGLFPYPFLLQILRAFTEGITPEEYNLFVCRASKPDSLEHVLSHIRKWRRLSPTLQRRVVAYLEDRPTESAKTGDDVSLYTRIERVRSYAWALFSAPESFVLRSRQNLRLDPTKLGELDSALDRFGRDSTFIEFDDEKDWFTYYGDSAVENSYATAMRVYEDRYDVERAVGALREAKERSLIEPTLSEADFREEVVREKIIEDILEYRLDLLEAGLTLYTDGVKSGRQFQTERGRIDLLARDSEGNWVVIELKKERAGDKVLGQTLRYLGWVRQNKLQEDQQVRGMIVGKPIDQNLITAAHGAHGVPLKLFEFDFRLGVMQRYPTSAASTQSG